MYRADQIDLGRDFTPRGRPLERPDLTTRTAILAFLKETPGASVADLQAAFGGVSRRTLAETARRYRRVRQCYRETLTWTLPGRVWAADYSETPCPVDGDAPYLLVVRDLASSEILASTPCESQSAEATCRVLEALIAVLGAPYVLKTDNGSPLIARRVKKLLRAHQITLLCSPPGTPRYNGSVEAGIGAIKRRADERAWAAGRSDAWTSDDVEGARLAANEAIRRQRGPRTSGPVAAQGLTRREFRSRLATQLWAARKDLRDGPNRLRVAMIRRKAMRQALVASGLLVVERRRTSSSVQG